jgi:xylulokinase
MGSSAGTATLEWYMQLTGYDQKDRYDWLWADVEAGHEGSEIFIPYLSGERAPILAPHATGTFLGVTTSTTPQRMARAVTEGITHALRWGIDSVLHAQSPKEWGTVVLAGGGSQATGWAHQVANCLGVPIVVDGRGDLGARGVARAVFGSPATTLADSDVVPVAPDERHTLVAHRYRAFLAAVRTLLPLWSEDNPVAGVDEKDNRVD